MNLPLAVSVVLAAASALAPVPALAGPTLTVAARGGNPDVATDAAGTSYVVWNESAAVAEGASPVNALHLCRIPAHGTACAVAPVLGPASVGPPRVLLDATGGVLVVSRQPSPSAPGVFDIVVRRSADGGATFAAPVVVTQDATTTPLFAEARLDPAGAIDTVLGVADAGHFFRTAALDGSQAAASPPSARLFDLAAASPGAPVALGAAPDGRPLAVWHNPADLTVNFRLGPAGIAGNDLALWSPLTMIGPGTEPALASGPAGTFLLSSRMTAQLTHAYELRQFTPATGFSTPVPLAAADTVSSQADLVQDASGRLHAVFPGPGGLQYRRSDRPPDLAALATSRAATIGCIPQTSDLRLGASAAGGVVAWAQAEGGGSSVKAATTDAAGCGAAADRTPPEMAIGRRLSVKGATVALRVTCPDVETRCTGRAELRLARGSRPGSLLGRSKSFKLAGGRSSKLKIKLTKAAGRRLARRGRLRIFVVVTAADALGNSGSDSHRTTLLAP